MKTLILCLLISLQMAYLNAFNLPIQLRCQITDSPCLGTLSKLLLESFPDGIPSLGINSFDPMKLDFFRVEQDDLKFEIKDVTIQGIKDLVIDEFRVDLKNNVSHSIFHSDVVVTGLYRATGSVLFTPIYGDGDFVLTLKNVETEIFDSIHIVKENGADFMKSKKYFFRSDVKDHAEIRLTNLYKGDKKLSDAMHDLINSNWKFLIRQFGNTLLAKAINNMVSIVYKVLALVPLNILVTY